MLENLHHRAALRAALRGVVALVGGIMLLASLLSPHFPSKALISLS